MDNNKLRNSFHLKSKYRSDEREKLQEDQEEPKRKIRRRELEKQEQEQKFRLAEEQDRKNSSKYSTGDKAYDCNDNDKHKDLMAEYARIKKERDAEKASRQKELCEREARAYNDNTQATRSWDLRPGSQNRSYTIGSKSPFVTDAQREDFRQKFINRYLKK